MQTVTGTETVAPASGSSDRGVAPSVAQMVEILFFDDEFRLTGRRKFCTLWANEPKFKRVCFTINTDILPDGRKAASRIHDFGELQLCEGERSYIEAACRRAFANRPNRDIELQPSDFAQPMALGLAKAIWTDIFKPFMVLVRDHSSRKRFSRPDLLRAFVQNLHKVSDATSEHVAANNNLGFRLLAAYLR